MAGECVPIPGACVPLWPGVGEFALCGRGACVPFGIGEIALCGSGECIPFVPGAGECVVLWPGAGECVV